MPTDGGTDKVFQSSLHQQAKLKSARATFAPPTAVCFLMIPRVNHQGFEDINLVCERSKFSNQR